jgi:1-acyl-sn-glycerol-3-phosphate acyltransferase
MLQTLIRVPFGLLLLSVNTLLHAIPLLLLALVKLLLPHAGARAAVSALLVRLAESWIAVNSTLIAWFTPTRIEVEGVDDLPHDGWYLVLANHQSWVDIPVLQQVFNRRIPMLKFFLKQQLIWVPVLGLAWWALDFPFMRRYSKETLARHPELRGRDKAATRRACRRFSQLPVSVMNFVEGTRFTPAKQAAQDGGYRHLLRPKAGGVAFVLEAMGDILRSLVDVTIAYPGGRPTVFDLFAGRVQTVRVHVRTLPIPAGLVGRDYETDTAFREQLQAWLNGLWQDKDRRLDAMLAGTPSGDA